MTWRPHVVVLAGPNGAGKSTTAPMLLRGKLGVDEAPLPRPMAHASAFW